MHIVSVGHAFPSNYYGQAELIEAFVKYWSTKHFNSRRVNQLHEAVKVTGRYLALPMEEYPALSGFGAANDAFIRVGTEIGAQAITNALEAAGLKPSDVDAIYSTSVTGVATPSLDARIVNRIGLPNHIKRVPIFGLGCVAGAAGVSRLYDYLKAWPDQVAVLLSVELCSLTLQRADLSIPNLIASGLFGDGSAAVVAVGDERARRMGLDNPAAPTVVSTRSQFYPNTEQVMGWDISEDGFKIILSADVPIVARNHMGEDVRQFLAEQGLKLSDIHTWVCHPGGPKVLQAFQEALELDDDALALTWNSLADVGNLSSSSVLLVLGDTIAQRPPPKGSLGMMLAMGPGFCSEMVLLKW